MIRRFLVLFLTAAAFFLNAVCEAGVEVVPAADGGVQPQLAVSPSGRIDVVYGQGNSVFYTNSKDGKSFLPAVKIGEVQKLALGRRRGPRIATSRDLIAVSAISHTDGDLHLWTSRDDGKTWQAGENLNTVSTSAREGLHAMAGDGKGVVMVAWLDLRNRGTELWSRASQDGGLTWAPETRVYASPDGHICECCHPSVAIAPNGRIAVMWRNWLEGSRDMWMSSSDDGGRSFGPGRKLGSGTWKLNACPMDGGALAFLANGTLSAVWRRQSLVVSGGESGEEKPLAQMAAQPVVAVNGVKAYEAWEQAGTIFLMEGGKARPMGRGSFPSLVANPQSGGVFLAWQGEEGGVMGESVP